MLKLCRKFMLCLAILLATATALPPLTAFSQDAEDSQIFITGFNAYQQKDYFTAIDKLNDVLKKYPDTPLRDMAIFWLSRAYFKNGNQQDAARLMSQFSKEYPDNPLKSTVEEELLNITTRFDKGEKLPAGPSRPEAKTSKPEEQQAALKKTRVEREKMLRDRLEKGKDAKQRAEENLLADGREPAPQAELTAREQALKQKAAEEQAAQKQARTAAQTARLQQEKLDAEKAALRKKEAEQEKLASMKAEEERKVREQAEQQRLAREKTEQEKAEAERLAASKTREEADRVALEKTEAENLFKEKALLESSAVSAEKAIAEKAQKERLAADRSEKERIAREKSESDRIAALKAEEERKARNRAEQERVEKEREERDRIAREKAESERLAALKAEEERTARNRAEQEKAEKEREERDRMVREKAEAERLAARKAQEEADRVALEKTEARKLTQEKARLEQSAVKSQQETLAAAREAEKLNARKRDLEREAAQKAEQDRLTEERKASEAMAAKLAAEAAKRAEREETERLASARSNMEKLAASKAAEEQASLTEASRIARQRAEEERAARSRLEAEKAAEDAARAASLKAEAEKPRTDRKALREKAIAEYRSIIDKFPGTNAAKAAAAKLQDLGLAVALPHTSPVPESKPAVSENAQIFRLEVVQYAGFEFSLRQPPQSTEVGRRIALPFEITNRGNGKDAFYLESGFPAEYNVTFAAESAPETVINQTRDLEPGQSFLGVINLTVPPSVIDGMPVVHPVKAASRYMTEASQSREVRLRASAPLLRAVVKADKTHALPGERITYRISVMNLGSAQARDISLRFNFPPQLEPVDHAAAGFRQEMKAALVIDNLKAATGDHKEFAVSFQVKDDSLAGQEIICNADLVDTQLQRKVSFISAPTVVKPLTAIALRATSDRLLAIPGQTMLLPVVITNSGNLRDTFSVATQFQGAKSVTVYLDQNRDGIRQSAEPEVNSVGPLGPREEAAVLVEITTPKAAQDGTEASLTSLFTPASDKIRVASLTTRLVYSRPVLAMTMSSEQSKLKPGDVASFELAIQNRGSNLAKTVELKSSWPEQLDFIAAEPPVKGRDQNGMEWLIQEVGAGEKKVIKVSFRVKAGIGVGTNIQVKNILHYEDQIGNRY